MRRAVAKFAGRDLEILEVSEGRWVAETYPTWEAALAATVRERAVEVRLPFPASDTNAEVLEALLEVSPPDEGEAA